MDVPQSGAAELHGAYQLAQAAVHQHHIPRVNSHVCTGTDGHTHIRRSQGRGIVDAVAHHGDLALLLEILHRLGFSVRQHVGNHPVNPGLLAHGLRRSGVIPGDHHHLDAQGFELLDGLGAVGLYRVSYGNHTCKHTVTGKVQRGFSRLGKGLGLKPGGFFQGGKVPDKVRLSGGHSLSLPTPCQAVARVHPEVLHRGNVQVSFRPLLQNRLCKGVFAAFFQGAGQSQQLPFLPVPKGKHVCYLG